MKTEERSRHTVWMEDTVWQRVQEHYKSDRCSTQNEFVAKAILFYCGYLQSFCVRQMEAAQYLRRIPLARAAQKALRSVF